MNLSKKIRIHNKKRVAQVAALFLLGIMFSFGLIVGCTKKETAQPMSADEILMAKGKSVYMSNCIACHNSDPTKDGSLGPALKNSSLELLQAKILTASYPSGYTPKRNTKIMQPMPQVQNDIEALHKFLQ